MTTQPARIDDTFVTTAHHGRIHYRSTGAGAPLLLLHSNGGSAYQYDLLAPLLADQFRVIAWTMPGHGDSDPVVRHYRIEDYADAVVEFMTAIGVESAYVAGSSVGGSICADLAARHGVRFRGVLAIEAPARSWDEWGARWTQMDVQFGLPLQSFEAVQERVHGLTPELHQRWNIDRCKAGGKLMVDVMWAIREFDILRAVANKTAPLSFIFGAQGPNAVFQDKLRAADPTLRFDLIAASQHFPMLDAPEALADVLRATCAAWGSR